MKTSAKSIAGVALLAVAYAGGSWWLGKIIEDRYQAGLDRLLAVLGIEKVLERSYERGWFSAKAQLVLQFSQPSLSAQDGDDAENGHDDAARPRPMRIRLQSDVLHGPLPGLRLAAATIRTHVAGVDGVDSALRQAFAQASWPTLNMVRGFADGVTGQLELPAGAFSEVAQADEPQQQAGLKAQWQRMVLDFRMGGKQGKHQQGTLRWPEFTLTGQRSLEDEAFTLHMQGMRYTYDAMLDEQQWLMTPGVVQGQIGTVEWRKGASTAGKTLFAMRDARMETRITRSDELLEQTLHMHGKGSLGSTAVDELRLESSLRRVDRQALIDAQKLFMRTLDAQDTKETQADSGLDNEQVVALVQRFMDAQPEYEDRYSASLNGQTMRLSYGFFLREAPQNHAALPGMPWQIMAVQRLNAHVNLHLPKFWLPVLARMWSEQEASMDEAALTKLVDELLAHGWLRQEGDDAYAADARLDSGQLLLNGKPFFGGRRLQEMGQR